MKICYELDIAQVSKLTGMPASKIRYYEEKRLIKSIGRIGLKRVFSASIVDQLSLISLGQYAGFSPDEIGTMFSPNGQATIDRSQLLEKADELDKKIQQFITLRESIVHVANCPEPNQLECPRFQALIRLSARKRLDKNSTKMKKP